MECDNSERSFRTEFLTMGFLDTERTIGNCYSFTTNVFGVVKCTDFTLYEMEGKEEFQVGRLMGAIVHVGDIINAETSHFDVFDQEQWTLEYYEALFDLKTEDVKSSVCTRCGIDFVSNDIFLISTVEFLPAFRGRGLGHSLIRQAMQLFKCEVTATIPCPLQFGNYMESDNWYTKMGIDRLSKNEKQSTERLRQYVRAHGFKRVPRTDCYVRGAFGYLDLDYDGVEEIGRHPEG